jgi:hypothetical protein
MSSLPPSLVLFQTQLEDAIGRAARARRRRRLGFRVGTVAVTAVAAVTALAAANVVTDRAPSVVDRAAAALTTSGDAILHIRLTGERTEPDGTVATWESEGWRETSEPFAMRQVEESAAGRVEWAYDGELHQVYDARSNTIYEVNKLQLGEALRDNEVPPRKLAPSQEAQLAKKRAAVGKETSSSDDHASDKHGDSSSERDAAQAPEEKFRDSVLEMLRSGEARVEGHVVADGRDAIRIVSVAQQATYLVDAETYNPIEWRSSEVGGSTTILRFQAYEQLPGTDANRALVNLRAQHPTAGVSHDADAAAAALGLLEGRGGK